jgi:alpha-glucosidase (family GH31 glycosyl hydrolase)
LAALVFDYQDDPKTYGMDYEFMLGRQILVAPVLEKVDKWEVYLPKGKWVHYWTGKEYEGGQMATVDAPLYGKDGLPMFVKAGAIIPMMPEMSYIYERKAEPITLDIYPDESKPSSYVMYDCETVRGPFKKTSFKCVEAKKTIQKDSNRILLCDWERGTDDWERQSVGLAFWGNVCFGVVSPRGAGEAKATVLWQGHRLK